MEKGHFMMHSQLIFQMQCTYDALIISKLYNIEDKLSSMGISAHSKHEILADIFGVTRNGICALGLVDAEDESDFDAKLSTLKHCWNELLSSKGK